MLLPHIFFNYMLIFNSETIQVTQIPFFLILKIHNFLFNWLDGDEARQGVGNDES